MNILEQKIKEFEELCIEISKGRSGVDFMIEVEENGIDTYAQTPLESQFVKMSRNITNLISKNSDLYSEELKQKILSALDYTKKAQGSYRGRTPAYGGDWQDIVSPIRWEIENHLILLYDFNFSFCLR